MTNREGSNGNDDGCRGKDSGCLLPKLCLALLLRPNRGVGKSSASSSGVVAMKTSYVPYRTGLRWLALQGSRQRQRNLIEAFIWADTGE